MPMEIRAINVGGVYCYLVKSGDSYMLIDTGMATKRAFLESELERAGCKPGNLKLIILTHGDVDHTDNAAYLRDKYTAKIAMHHDDAGMVEHGEMSWNRKAKPDRVSALGAMIILLGKITPFFGTSKFETFSPDICVEDGQDLSEYGFDAKVVYLPGHSMGSIGILTAGGDLFCGDLLMMMGRPSLHFMIDDMAAANASVEKLKHLDIGMVYPGHFGGTFPMTSFMKK
jgi:hydroxyacylglutathione hydrolase